jgi:hypothetical protein
MGKCALINDECPETADRTKRRFCPHWKVGIPSVDPKLGFMAHPTFTGCFLDIAPAYQIATARDAAHSAAAFNEARDHLSRNGEENGEPMADLLTMGLVALGGAVRGKRLALQSDAEPPALPAAADRDSG